MKIKIPNNNINERKYILDILFNEFLGLEYSLHVGSRDYEIELQNGKILTIKDTFFSKYPNDLEYLHVDNIPSKIEELDIFAASFFMLTRWEEYVNKNRDMHDRFPATESLAYKQGFLDRPIVNEYVEELKVMLLELDDSLVFKEREYELFLTHDVDKLYMWKSWKQVLQVALGDIVKRKSFGLAMERVAEYFLIKREKIKDPFDTFDWLMDKSESIGVKSRFYFMSGGVTVYDNRYKIDEPKSLELIEKIKSRGHIIGIHPSYSAFNDSEQFKKELDLLEKIVGQKITEGREHYLRFEVPTTWQIWEDNGMKVDSTCGYADKEGFRCGTGDEFSVFNILSREKLRLRERPLIYMDDNRLFGERIYDETFLIDNINLLKEKNIKYKNCHTLLFHQNIFAMNEINYKEVYEKVIK
ncbi:MAG: polysaccharide deacetylase family protein [Campylobacterota bacterium]|nr:polysaccharide deacetylase family protein [Campylobacterota bacterium]